MSNQESIGAADSDTRNTFNFWSCKCKKRNIPCIYLDKTVKTEYEEIIKSNCWSHIDGKPSKQARIYKYQMIRGYASPLSGKRWIPISRYWHLAAARSSGLPTQEPRGGGPLSYHGSMPVHVLRLKMYGSVFIRNLPRTLMVVGVRERCWFRQDRSGGYLLRIFLPPRIWMPAGRELRSVPRSMP